MIVDTDGTRPNFGAHALPASYSRSMGANTVKGFWRSLLHSDTIAGIHPHAAATAAHGGLT
jgi:hypothetical protein